MHTVWFGIIAFSYIISSLVWFGLVWFYCISTIVSYLMPNPVFTHTHTHTYIYIYIYIYIYVYIYISQIYDL